MFSTTAGKHTTDIEIDHRKRELDLDDIEGEASLAWVKEHNDEIDAVFSSTDEFKQMEKIALELFERKDKIHYPSMRNGYLYNFLQDKDHKQGLWRRTTLEEYRKEEPLWEPLLDIDALPEQEEWRALTDPTKHTNPTENWVYKGSHVHYPDGKRALIQLSLGGGDRSVYREYDIESKTFVKEGFQIREGKTRVSWQNEDALWIGTDFGEGSLTKSGYPRMAKLWRRGESLAEAPTIFTGETSDVSISASTSHALEGDYHIVTRAIDFYEKERYFINMDDFSLSLIPIPRDATIEDFFNHQVIISLRSDWEVPNGPYYPLGSVLALDLASIADPEHLVTSLVFSPTPTCVVEGVYASKSHLWLKLLNNVSGELHQFQHVSDGWISKRIPLPDLGDASLISLEDTSDDCFISYTNFLTPTSLYYYDGTTDSLELLKTAPNTFRSNQMVATQGMATSKDGTSIPYFIVHSKALKYDGSNPTLLYGYGGFEISLSPSYIGGSTGKFWLEEGGVYVVANIRGGGEFGPTWHKSVIKENRHKVFEDFIAVAEDLICRNITSPKHLGIKGGSNGGLLVGAVAMQRPELFNAVICSCPLLDMLKYHTMLAGYSWMAEYGDPDDPSMREIIKSYSPYHNVSEEKNYPRILFTSSTKDDRVHPGHARRMVDKMKSMGHEVYYYENTEGGHSGAANLKQNAFNVALNFSYLKQQLKPTLIERLRKIHDPFIGPSFFRTLSFSSGTGPSSEQKIALIQKLEIITDHLGWKVSKQHVAWIQCTDRVIAEALALTLRRTEAAIIKVSRRADKTAYVVQCQIVDFAQLLKDYSLLEEHVSRCKHNPSICAV